MTTLTLVSNEGVEFNLDKKLAVDSLQTVKDVTDGTEEAVVPMPQLSTKQLELLINYLQTPDATLETLTKNGEELMDAMNVAVYAGAKEMLKKLCAKFAERINTTTVTDNRKFFNIAPTLSLETETALRKKLGLWDNKEEGWDAFYVCSRGGEGEDKYCNFESDGEPFQSEGHTHQRQKCTRCSKTYNEEVCCREEYLKDPPPEEDETQEEEAQDEINE